MSFCKMESSAPLNHGYLFHFDGDVPEREANAPVSTQARLRRVGIVADAEDVGASHARKQRDLIC